MAVPNDFAHGSNEKNANIGSHSNKTQHGFIEKTSDHSAHILDITELGDEGQGLQTAEDGKTILIPQPSSDPHDPLNWSWSKKHIGLLIITVVAFLPDFGSSIGVVTLLPQAGYVILTQTTEKLANDA